MHLLVTAESVTLSTCHLVSLSEHCFVVVSHKSTVTRPLFKLSVTLCLKGYEHEPALTGENEDSYSQTVTRSAQQLLERFEMWTTILIAITQHPECLLLSVIQRWTISFYTFTSAKKMFFLTD